MIELTTGLWFLVSFSAGLLHAILLWRNAQQPSGLAPLWGMLRLFIVASILVFAALSGAIFAAASGWAIGFVAAFAWTLVRHTERRLPPSKTQSETG